MINRQQIKDILETHALDLVAVVGLNETNEEYSFYEKWLAKGRHADMIFMENNLHCRKDPRNLLEGSITAVVFSINYYQGDRYVARPPKPRVAQYAKIPDYHKLLKKKGEAVLKDILTNAGIQAHTGRVVTDSAPILERALANRGEEGFIGKNTCFIHPKKGSFTLLGEIVTTIPLEPDTPRIIDPTKRTEEGGCGTCKRCQVFCPTGALDKDYSLDAQKCLSYQTIENRGVIPIEYWDHLKQYFFGCDICQLVCPYNRNLEDHCSVPQKLKEDLNFEEIATMDQKYYEHVFGGTPLTRAKISGLRRNALIYLIVSNHTYIDLILEKAKKLKDPLVAATIDQIPEYQKLRCTM